MQNKLHNWTRFDNWNQNWTDCTMIVQSLEISALTLNFAWWASRLALKKMEVKEENVKSLR